MMVMMGWEVSVVEVRANYWSKGLCESARDLELYEPQPWNWYYK